MIQISKDYRIDSDAHNVILQERWRNQKKKEYFWRNVGYFATVQNALKELANMKLRDAICYKDLETICKKQQDIYDLIATCHQNV